MRRLGCVTLILAVFVAAAGTSGSAASATSYSSRNCPGQKLSCEQLVALGLTYPYAREPSSYLYVNGVAYPYVNVNPGSLADSTVRADGITVTARQLLQRVGLGQSADEPRTPVIAYGSNANVDALNRKFLVPQFSGPAVIPVMRATLKNFDVAWSPEFVFNGAMPATIGGSPGTRVNVWITWLDAAELKRMNATEGVGTLYSYGFLTGAALYTQGPAVAQPWVYVDCFGAVRVGGRVLAIRRVGARDRRFLPLDSAQALARVSPVIGWKGSVFDLLLDNVRSPRRRTSRDKLLKRVGVQLPEPGYQAQIRCAKH